MSLTPMQTKQVSGVPMAVAGSHWVGFCVACCHGASVVRGDGGLQDPWVGAPEPLSPGSDRRLWSAALQGCLYC